MKTKNFSGIKINPSQKKIQQLYKSASYEHLSLMKQHNNNNSISSLRKDDLVGEVLFPKVPNESFHGYKKITNFKNVSSSAKRIIKRYQQDYNNSYINKLAVLLYNEKETYYSKRINLNNCDIKYGNDGLTHLSKSPFFKDNHDIVLVPKKKKCRLSISAFKREDLCKVLNNSIEIPEFKHDYCFLKDKKEDSEISEADSSKLNEEEQLNLYNTLRKKNTLMEMNKSKDRQVKMNSSPDYYISKHSIHNDKSREIYQTLEKYRQKMHRPICNLSSEVINDMPNFLNILRIVQSSRIIRKKHSRIAESSNPSKVSYDRQSLQWKNNIKSKEINKTMLMVLEKEEEKLNMISNISNISNVSGRQNKANKMDKFNTDPEKLKSLLKSISLKNKELIKLAEKCKKMTPSYIPPSRKIIISQPKKGE